MKSRGKACCLLLIFLINLVPYSGVSARQEINRSLQNALDLMYLSEAVTLPEEEINDSLPSPGLQMPLPFLPHTAEGDPLLARIIHAEKQQRNDLDAAYRLLVTQYKQAGKDCEAERVKQVWQDKRKAISYKIGLFRKVRGDRRKVFTRLWHDMKRVGGSFWRRIGKVGRRFLRDLGPEVLQVVVSGGTLSGGVIRKLVKNRFRTMAQEHIQRIVYKGVARLIQGQLDLALAAGVDLCGIEQDGVQAEEEQEKQKDSESLTSIPDGTKWICEGVGEFGKVSQTTTKADEPWLKVHDTQEVHWIVLDTETQTLHYYYSYEKDFSAALSNDCLDNPECWTHYIAVGTFDESNIPLFENGTFKAAVDHTYNNLVDEQSEVGTHHSKIWGIIPPEDYGTIYLCDWWNSALDMPTDQWLSGITSENFFGFCGPVDLGSYCYTCTKTSQ